MTVREAIERRIPRVRRPMWADPCDYLRLPLRDDGTAGAWAELYSVGIQQDVLKIRPGSQRELVIGRNADEPADFEVYTGPVSAFELHPDNFASRYAEQ